MGNSESNYSNVLVIGDQAQQSSEFAQALCSSQAEWSKRRYGELTVNLGSTLTLDKKTGEETNRYNVFDIPALPAHVINSSPQADIAHDIEYIQGLIALIDDVKVVTAVCCVISHGEITEHLARNFNFLKQLFHMVDKKRRFFVIKSRIGNHLALHSGRSN